MELLLRMAVIGLLAASTIIASATLKRYLNKQVLPSRFDRRDVDADGRGPMLVEFTSPYCIECQIALPVLEAAAQAHSASLAVIDARERPDLTDKYSIRSTPTILVVDEKGKVTTGWKMSPSEEDVSRALASAAS